MCDDVLCHFCWTIAHCMYQGFANSNKALGKGFQPAAAIPSSEDISSLSVNDHNIETHPLFTQQAHTRVYTSQHAHGTHAHETAQHSRSLHWRYIINARDISHCQKGRGKGSLMGSTPTSVITTGFSGFPYFARVRAALSSPIKEASLLTCISKVILKPTTAPASCSRYGHNNMSNAALCYVMLQPVCVLDRPLTCSLGADNDN